MFVGSGAPTRQEPGDPRPLRLRPASTSASTGSTRSPSGTPRRSASGCSSSASATRPWTAAAPRGASAASDIKVMARKPRAYFKASPWELEDAEEEQVEIVVNHAPVRFIVENGVLKGMEFERYESKEEGGKLVQKALDKVILPADDVILAIGQEAAFPWIESDVGLELDKWGSPVVDKVTFQSSKPGVFFGGDAAWGPLEHHLGGRARAPGGHLDPQPLPGHRDHRAAAAGHDADHHEDGPARVGLQERLQPRRPPEDAARRPGEALRGAVARGRAGLLRRADRARGRALPELRRGDRVHREAVHRVRRVRRRVPRAVPDHRAERRGERRARAPERAGGQPEPGALRVGRRCRRPGA